MDNDDGIEVMSRAMLAEALVNDGAKLEIKTKNQREKAEVDFNEASKVFARAKETFALHKTKSKPSSPKESKRI